MPKAKDVDVRIVILQRGWVMVGAYERKGEHATLSHASVIRRWGTTKGLGELAANGPLGNTVLDPCPNVEFHQLTEIANMKCEASKWAAHLK